MIKATYLHSEFNRRANRGKSDADLDFNVEQRDSYLTEAYQIWFETKIPFAETNQKIRNDLRPFEIPKHCVKAKAFDADCYTVEFPSDYYSSLNVYTIAEKDPCGKRRLKTKILQSSDIDDALKSPNRKPSYEYEYTFAEEAGNKLYVYHDGTFKIKQVCFDYYRKPEEIRAPSLIVPEGSYLTSSGKLVSKDQDLEITSTFAARQIVDIAVLIANGDSLDQDKFSLQLQKILQVENLYR